MPTQSTEGAVGWDLYAPDPQTAPSYAEGKRLLGKGSNVSIDTGVRIEFPDDLAAHVHGRSGMLFRHDISVPTGTIDSDYRGTIGVKLFNLGIDDYWIAPGERIAQLIFFCPLTTIKLVQTQEPLNDTQRNEGYGSSGR